MNKSPIEDRNFVRYLIIFGVGLLLAWIAFSWVILPMLPASLAGGLATLGYGVIAVVWGLTILYLFEKRHPDGD